MVSAAHHVESAGIAFGELGGVAVLHGTGLDTGFHILNSRCISAIGNGDCQLLRLVLHGRELFLRAGYKQQEQRSLQEVVYVLYLHILKGLNRQIVQKARTGRTALLHFL